MKIAYSTAWRIAGMLILFYGAAMAEPFADETSVFNAERVVYRDVDVTLEGALFHGDDVPWVGERFDLVLYLGERDGVWREQFVGWAGMRWTDAGWDSKGRRFNSMDHEGRVTRQGVAEKLYTLDVEVAVRPDPWVPGGKAKYTLSFSVNDGKLTGTYTGTFRGKAIKGKLTGTIAADPWPAPVKGWQPLAKGEHPRLMFRKADLPKIKARAATPEGQRIVARMKKLLGGGEDFPDRHSTAKQAYSKSKKLPLGSYTLGHGVGYGMLYQLTGEQKYADLGKQATELALKGIRDRDDRYAFINAGGKLRHGPSVAQVALAYDLCYHGWPEAFRMKVAVAIQRQVWNPDAPLGEKALKEPTGGDLIFNTIGGQHSPHSNHYGAWNGGAGVGILAILGDPGTDDAITYRAHRVSQQRAERALEVGYGDSGWFFEGHHGGRLNFNTGLAEYLHALRVGAGLDYVGPFPGGDWLVTKWCYELTRSGRKINHVNRGIYAQHGFTLGTWSGSGDFSIGFSHVPDAHRPAVEWFYKNVITAAGDRHDHDARVLPSRAAWALVNWPIDVEAKNPETVLPKYLLDAKANYYVFRSGWSKGGNDWVVANHINQAYVRGPGLSTKAGIGTIKFFQKAVPLADGQAVAIFDKDQVMVADMSGVSGAPILLVTIPLGATAEQNAADEEKLKNAPPWVKRELEKKRNQVDKTDPAKDPELSRKGARHVDRRRTVGGQTWRVWTLQSGGAPMAAAVDGAKSPALQVGQRTISFDGKSVTLGEATAR